MSSQHTKILNVNNFDDANSVKEAAKLLKNGELVAFPTETVYGLGANGLSTEAVQNIFTAKGRPSDNPLILHIGQLEQLDALVFERSELANQLIESFWPGALTLVMKRSQLVPDIVTARLDTVAIRMPSHPVARRILKEVQLPIAAPSANRSGRPSPTLAAHVMNDLNGRIAAVVDGGACGYGLESTVVDLSGDVPVILRPGGVTEEMIEDAVGTTIMRPTANTAEHTPKSPGMKYRHYAPDTALIIGGKQANEVQELIDQYRNKGKRVAAAVTDDLQKEIQADHHLNLGEKDRLDRVSQRVYQVLREVDALQPEVDVCIIQSFEEKGLGRAIMNRLNKAANV
ncbi:L-threonylcarbamoyladenylate synthase [Geomicrobium sp. JCM 19039]|uniref:L-threonylcarbamoyladenylate synthase n=1 Tax=Geomicrobium sp. JCM 19039 TaxID=1460636 RepID=UPI00045F24DB|nr:L-threonylcarbamoyladenylate synthase [Geomicrobium sp. JCM 19039]GAK14473.1 YrdC/Sua5 family protein [Geomicrobium sp. JCM 19039]